MFVPASNVAPLPKVYNEQNPMSQVVDYNPLPAGSRVLAMYPNTTSFYNATVVASRKQVKAMFPQQCIYLLIGLLFCSIVLSNLKMTKTNQE